MKSSQPAEIRTAHLYSAFSSFFCLLFPPTLFYQLVAVLPTAFFLLTSIFSLAAQPLLHPLLHPPYFSACFCITYHPHPLGIRLRSFTSISFLSLLLSYLSSTYFGLILINLIYLLFFLSMLLPFTYLVFSVCYGSNTYRLPLFDLLLLFCCCQTTLRSRNRLIFLIP